MSSAIRKPGTQGLIVNIRVFGLWSLPNIRDIISQHRSIFCPPPIDSTIEQDSCVVAIPEVSMPGHRNFAR